MNAPWFSGMAQGLVLSLEVRLFELTGDPAALTRAGEVFASFEIAGPRGGPWVTWVDRDRYLWIEEYPSAHPDRALNGFIFGVFGVYDYWRVTRDPDAERILLATVTTLRHYVTKYRRPGVPSYYCLAHVTRRSPTTRSTSGICASSPKSPATPTSRAWPTSSSVTPAEPGTLGPVRSSRSGPHGRAIVDRAPRPGDPPSDSPPPRLPPLDGG